MSLSEQNGFNLEDVKTLLLINLKQLTIIFKRSISRRVRSASVLLFETTGVEAGVSGTSLTGLLATMFKAI